MSETLAIERGDGSRLNYTDSGAGITLLFVHGWLMSRRVWVMQSPLTAEFRVISLDLRGHGDDRGTVFSYEGCCEDLALLVERLQLDRTILVGWSMGSQIALRVHSLLAEKVAAMVLVGGTPLFCQRDDFDCGIAPAEVRNMALRLKRDYQRTAGEFFRQMFSEMEVATLDLPAIAGRVVGKLPERSVALSALQALINCDLRAALQSVAVPVLLVHGDADSICPADASRFMTARMLAAKLEIFAAAGHAPFLTRPEEFNRLLAGFAQAVHGQN